MSLFDFNVALGRAASPVGGAFDTPAQLLEELARLEIGEALVYHTLAAEADVMRGNRLLSEQLAGHSTLHPCWVMAPSALGDLPEADRWVREAHDAQVRAVRLIPRHSLYSLTEPCIDGLLTELGSAHMPLVIDFGCAPLVATSDTLARDSRDCSAPPQPLRGVVRGNGRRYARRERGLARRLKPLP